MLLEHSSGWLLEQMVALDTDAEKWWKQGGIGFVDADPDHDPMFDGGAEPPPGWELLPVYQPEEVSRGE